MRDPEPSDLPATLRSALASLGLWMRISEPGTRYFGPTRETTVDTVNVAWFNGCLLSSVAVLFEAFGTNRLVLLLMFFVGVAVSYILFKAFVELALGWESDLSDWTGDLWAFGSGVFVVVWTLAAVFGRDLPVLFPLFLLVLVSVAFVAIGLALLGACCWLIPGVVYWLTKRYPARTTHFFISYRAEDVPPDLRWFVNSLKRALRSERLTYCDGPELRRALRARHSERSVRQRVISAVGNSGIVVAVVSDEYLNSRWGPIELGVARARRRPTLAIVMCELSSTNAEQLPRSPVPLFEYIREAERALDGRTTPADRHRAGEEVAARLMTDIQQFIGALCLCCHGHRTDARYRLRGIPIAFRLGCGLCRGSGRDPLVRPGRYGFH